MRAAVILLFVFILPMMGGITVARAAEDGVFVCVEMTDDECTQYAPVLEGVSSMEDVGFSPEAIVYIISWGAGLILGLWLFGLGVGSIWRFFDAALGGPLS